MSAPTHRHAASPLPASLPTPASHVTLVGTTVLHAFTHAYATMFYPLYVMMRVDLGVTETSKVTALASAYMIICWILSYPAGLLADRYDRRWILALGLLVNAAAITGMAFTHSYPLLITLCLIGGISASLFHPAANALVPAHYPRSPGLAIGLLGVGSGVGFFAGPFFAGLIAQAARAGSPVAAAGGVGEGGGGGGGGFFADWQLPFFYMGVAGLICAVLFALTAREAGSHVATAKPPISPELRKRTLLHAIMIAIREFAGVGASTLTALYLLKALNFNTQRTGQFLGVAMLAAAFVNPLIVYTTAGRKRLPAHVLILIVAAAAMLCVPLFPPALVLVPLIIQQTLVLASSAVGDAALTERIDPQVRGRINGMYLTIVGTVAATSPFFIGLVIDRLGHSPTRLDFLLPYAALTAALLASTFSAVTLARLGKVLALAPDSSPPSSHPSPEPAAPQATITSPA